MYFALLAVVVSIFLTTTAYHIKYKQSITQNRIIATKLNNTTKRLQKANIVSMHYKPQNIQIQATKEKELIQKILLRTCNAIYQKGILNRCANAEKASTVWGFVGALGSKGTLDGAWTGAVSSTFSCGGEDSYGRYLVQHTVSANEIHAQTWGYNLKDIDDNSTYPCGYSEIVTK